VSPTIRLSVVALLAVLGAAMGAALGRSSVAEINPIYFREPESTRFFADLTAQGYDFDAGAADDPQAFWTNELVVRPPACLGCRRNNVIAAAVAAEASAVAAQRSAYALQEDMPVPPPATDFHRYMTFPINQEEAARAAAHHAERFTANRVQEGSYRPSPQTGEPIGM
jgi:hypothetical protein